MRNLFLLLLLAPFCAYAQIITTYAGNNTYGYSGDGGPVGAAVLSIPWSVTVDRTGNVYIGDHACVRKVNTSGIINTIAGSNLLTTYVTDNGPATAGKLGEPIGIAVDAAGNIYIADLILNNVRKVDVYGIITTVAGTGAATSTGDGGPATAATIVPLGVVIDKKGNLYISDAAGYVVRKVDVAGIITTIAGQIGFNSYGGDGGPATAASFQSPEGLTIDAIGNLYIADRQNNRVRKIDTFGIISTVVGNGQAGFSCDGGLADTTEINNPHGAAVDNGGNIYITDFENFRIRKVEAGIISTLSGDGVGAYAGDGGPATAAQIAYANGIAVGNNSIYIADQYCLCVRRIGWPNTGADAALEKERKILLFPNPATDVLTIDAGDMQAGKIVITNMVGQVVYEKNCLSVKEQISVAYLPGGVYYVSVNDITTGKFIKE